MASQVQAYALERLLQLHLWTPTAVPKADEAISRIVNNVGVFPGAAESIVASIREELKPQVVAEIAMN